MRLFALAVVCIAFCLATASPKGSAPHALKLSAPDAELEIVDIPESALRAEDDPPKLGPNEVMVVAGPGAGFHPMSPQRLVKERHDLIRNCGLLRVTRTSPPSFCASWVCEVFGA